MCIRDRDKRGSVHPSGDQIKVMMETRSKQQEKIAWDLDEQAIQLEKNQEITLQWQKIGQDEDVGLPRPQHLSGMEAAAAAKPLKGTTSMSRFSI